MLALSERCISSGTNLRPGSRALPSRPASLRRVVSDLDMTLLSSGRFSIARGLQRLGHLLGTPSGQRSECAALDCFSRDELPSERQVTAL